MDNAIAPLFPNELVHLMSPDYHAPFKVELQTECCSILRVDCLAISIVNCITTLSFSLFIIDELGENMQESMSTICLATNEGRLPKQLRAMRESIITFDS